MTDHLAVTRTAEFDLSPDELWALVSDGRRWSEWMVDRADIDVAEGATGTVVDDGVIRHVAVRSVSVDGVERFSSQLSSWTTDAATRSFRGRVVFEWRPLDESGEATVVELEVGSTDDGGSRLRVVETSASAAASTGFAWDLRLLSMCSCVAMCCRT